VQLPNAKPSSRARVLKGAQLPYSKVTIIGASCLWRRRVAAGICLDLRLRVPDTCGIAAVVKSHVALVLSDDALSVLTSVLTVRIVSVDPVEDSVPDSRRALPDSLMASARSFWISSICSSI
jgi:hypothetical protein